MEKKVKHICFFCECKLNTLDIIVGKCRCEYLFCAKHRLDHECTFDYINDYKKNNNLVKITSRRVDNI